ncbi:hypothetical protein Nepgr_006137 [Nepenthes gracilis]|uniref:Uncharacterized protein n=1 Tax=Nepenthes gracilis TaxID=150966 RepID=A0AAD3S4J5_NEPGR|nr:hypothetical protein Nepgr_006137 [Nepenthes gracilis]
MKERQRWKPEEDALLRAYVKQYGPREWNLVSQRMGKPLHRDPKSCLERWRNYLMPGIKKGSLTAEEHSLVVSLQAKYGNKWKKIAAEVPGRTAKRLGKWWEVFKEKQLKQQNRRSPFFQTDLRESHAAGRGGASTSPGKALLQLRGQYDHILDTFTEKYVQNKSFPLQPVPLSLASMPSLSPQPVFPLWMGTASSPPPAMPFASVSLSSFPSEPAAVGLDPVLRFMEVQQLGTLVQFCEELEERKRNWLQHRKEACWRLSRLSQQLEAEKARKKSEKMVELEVKIRLLKEEEAGYLRRIESECKEQLISMERDAESKEAELMEAWFRKRAKLAEIIEQLRAHVHGIAAGAANG